MHDVVIIGGGPAGMTAAIYAARKRLDLVMISPDIGGQATWAVEVENYLGFAMITGIDLAEKFAAHVKEFDVHLIDSKVTAVEVHDKTFLTKLENGDEFESRTVLVASGRSARNLGVPGEETYKGKGVAYCATCDAPLYSGEDVAVVGGGNAGLSSAVQLISIARQVYIIESMPKLNGDQCFQERISKSPNAKVMTNTEVKDIVGNKLVEGIDVRDFTSGKEERIPVTGVFVEIGSLPNTDFLPANLMLNKYREIEIDNANRTNIPGLVAAGDVTDVPHKQIIIAAGEGAKAMLTAYDYLVRTFPAEG